MPLWSPGQLPCSSAGPVPLALRRLERNGLIARRVLATSPVAVEYSITDLGRTLQAPLGAAYDWAIEHQREIERAQEAYDASGRV